MDILPNDPFYTFSFSFICWLPLVWIINFGHRSRYSLMLLKFHFKLRYTKMPLIFYYYIYDYNGFFGIMLVSSCLYSSCLLSLYNHLVSPLYSRPFCNNIIWISLYTVYFSDFSFIEFFVDQFYITDNDCPSAVELNCLLKATYSK